MSLTNEERQIMVRLEMEKADRFSCKQRRMQRFSNGMW